MDHTVKKKKKIQKLNEVFFFRILICFNSIDYECKKMNKYKVRTYDIAFVSISILKSSQKF